MSKNLDEIDLKILSEIQADGRITNVELARRVGISPPPCLRRVRTLEEEGYIQGYRGLLDPRRLGFDVTVFASVHLLSQADADLRAFEDFVRAEPLVRECWMLSGEVDFIAIRPLHNAYTRSQCQQIFELPSQNRRRAYRPVRKRSAGLSL